MNPPLGRCYWAVAPFAPEPPFRIYASNGDPVEVDSAERMNAASAASGMSEFVMLTPVKVRPVIVLSEVLSPYNEVLALRLKRLTTLDPDTAERIRQFEDERLFYLQPDQFGGLDVENAAIVNSLLKLPIDAIDTSTELGRLDLNELRVLHERVARGHGLMLDSLVLEKANELVARRLGREHH